jgi:ribonuclease HII
MTNEFDVLYPEFDFKNNVGYGTKKHIDYIREHPDKITPIHRKTFARVKEFVMTLEQ